MTADSAELAAVLQGLQAGPGQITVGGTSADVRIAGEGLDLRLNLRAGEEEFEGTVQALVAAAAGVAALGIIALTIVAITAIAAVTETRVVSKIEAGSSGAGASVTVNQDENDGDDETVGEDDDMEGGGFGE